MALVPLAVAVLVGMWPVQSLAATADVPTEREAWYQVSPADSGEEADPTCSLPAGCAPQPGLPANPYPENTLQVGVAGGRDTARTFLTLDLGALPSGALISGGTLTLPVLAGQDSGSLNPEGARLSACSVIGEVKDAQGGQPDQQPDFSCAAPAKAKYNAGANPTVTIDLAPVAAMLSLGGLAIVPSKEAREDGDTWRIAFPAREHAAKEQITAALSYDKPLSFGSVTTAPPPAPALGTTSSVGSIDPAPAPVNAPPASFADPVPADPPAAPAPQVAPTPAPAAVPTVAMGYAYPASWLAPLVLLALAGLLARTLTGEITLPDDDGAAAMSPNLLERLGAALRQPPPSTSPTQSVSPGV